MIGRKRLTLPARRPGPFGRALQNVGWLLTGKGVGAVLSLAYLALATRSLGVQSFGQFMLIVGIGRTAAAFAGFQTWHIVVRYGMAHLEHKRAGALGRLVRFCTALDLSAALVGCAIAAAVLMAIRWRFGWSEEITRDAAIFCIILLLSVRSTAVGILRLHDRFAVGAVADSVTPIVRFAGALIAVWQKATVTEFLITWAISEVLTAIVYWASAVRAAPGLMRHWRGTMRAPSENVGFWHFAFVTNLNSMLTEASRQSIVVVVGFFAGAAAAGNYRLAYQLSQSLVRVSDMFARGVFPEVARADVQEIQENFRKLVRQSIRFAITAGLIACLLVPILSEPALYLIAGKHYLDAYPILVILGIAAGLDIMTVGFEPVLLATGHAARALWIRVAAAFVLFEALLLLMPAFGVIGAGVATLLASAVALALFALVALRMASVADRAARSAAGTPSP